MGLVLILSELKSYGKKAIELWSVKQEFTDGTVTEKLVNRTSQNNSRFGSLIILLSVLYTRR